MILFFYCKSVSVKYLLNYNDFQLSNHAKLDSGNLEGSIENPLISVEDTRVADKAVENDDVTGSFTLNEDDGEKDILDKSKFYLPEHREDAKKDTGLMKDLKDNLVSNKDVGGTDENVLCVAGVGSMLVKDDQVSNKKDPRPYKIGSMKSYDTPVVLGSGQKILKSATVFAGSNKGSGSLSAGVVSEATDTGKLENVVTPLDEKAYNLRLKSDDNSGKIEGSSIVPSTTGSDKGKTELKLDVHIRTGNVRKLKSDNDYGALEDRPSKKLKHIGTPPIPRNDGGIITKQSAIVSAANNKASQSAGAAAKTNDEGEMNRLVGTSSGIPRLLKCNSITESKPVDKLHKLSTKQSRDQE